MSRMDQELDDIKQRLAKLERQMAFVLRNMGLEHPLPSFAETDYGVSHEIVELVRKRDKIQAIKLFRQDTGAGLKDAKDFIDDLEKKLSGK